MTIVAVPPPATVPVVIRASCAVSTTAICWLLAWAWSICCCMLLLLTPNTTATASAAAAATPAVARVRRPGQGAEPGADPGPPAAGQRYRLDLGGRPLAGHGGGGHDPVLQAGGHGLGRGGAEHGGRLAQARDLPRAPLAASQVPLEPVPVRGGDGVHRVRPSQGVLVALLFHSATPRQSRSRISASRILVFTVPVGTPSRLATWP